MITLRHQYWLAFTTENITTHLMLHFLTLNTPFKMLTFFTIQPFYTDEA